MHSGRVLATALLGTALTSATGAWATFTVTIEQVGSNVVMDGGGTIDLTDLTSVGPGNSEAGLQPNIGDVAVGDPPYEADDVYSGTVGMPAIGLSSSFEQASTGSGDKVADAFSEIWVPAGYVSGASLSDTSTFTSTTLASLGLTDGVYTDTWGTGGDADSFVVYVGVEPTSTRTSISTSVPEPASLALLGAGLAGIGAIRRRKHR